MKTMSGTRIFMAIFFLCSTPLFILLCAADETLPCPSPCKCQRQNYQPYGDVNTIECSAMELTSIPDLSSLADSPIPNNLKLDQNEIKDITKSNFPPGLNIVVLDLSQNLGVNISEDALLNLGYSLKELSIESVDIVYDKTLVIFDGLFSLKELSLNNNNKHPYTKGAVQNVDASLFQGEVAKNLKRLQLAYCSMRTISENSLKTLESLEELDLSNNWLTSIPPVIKPLKSLKFVEFFYCRINSIKNNDFSGLPKLEEIDLSSNTDLISIEDKAFSGCENSLTKLNIQRCSLTDVPSQALKNLKKLTFLDISENKLTVVKPGALEGEYKLNELIISSPNLQFTDNIFRGQESNIADLSIPRMNLKIIPLPSLQKLTKLKRLSLEYNNITTLTEDAFDGITATSIRLDNNPLSFIEPGAFNGMPPKLVVFLSKTKVSDIEFLLGYPDDAIDTVDLENANLACRCSMKSAVNVTQNIRVYGSCMKGEKMVHISSSKLEGILDQACLEETRNNSGNTANFIYMGYIPYFYTFIAILLKQTV